MSEGGTEPQSPFSWLSAPPRYEASIKNTPTAAVAWLLCSFATSSAFEAQALLRSVCSGLSFYESTTT